MPFYELLYVRGTQRDLAIVLFLLQTRTRIGECAAFIREDIAFGESSGMVSSWRLTLVILWVLQRSWAIALDTKRMYVQPTIEQLTEALECLDLNA
jgi:hypothetical protein